MTTTQRKRFEAAKRLLPDGLYYCAVYEDDGRLAGVDLRSDDDLLGWVGRPLQHFNWYGSDGWVDASAPAGARSAINRVAAALWHRQPPWNTEV
ncbi:MAG: hypothetical protein BWZ02_02924 [Lentisphaerae bacterium ADurb.BinA184]|nr:MAG: hypothetical protein BWZ02_02924 [Lentisphaerae bacterium ADurb.BinA184]